MFLKVEEINQKWISEKENLLVDTQLLISQLSQDSGNKMQHCIDKITSLNPAHKNAIIKDPIFLKWVSDLNNEILSVYENSSEIWSDEKLNQGLNLISLAISNLTEKDFSFLFLPQLEGIKIINKRIDPFFNEGSEYDVEFDFDIDEAKWLSTLRAALDLIKLDSTTHQLVKNFVSYLIPLKQKKVVQNLSFSSRNLPNVVFKNNEVSPYIFGETLVHEADHQFFYALENFYSVWNTDVKLQEAIYRSPWRDDARPLDGIIRGVSAFVRVCKYYSIVIKNVDEKKIDKIGSLQLLRLCQCEDAISTLLNSNQLSDFGKEYVLEMKDILQQSDSSVKHYSNYKNWRADAIITISNQKANWEKIHDYNNMGPLSIENFTGKNFVLFNQFTSIEKSVPVILEEVFNKINEYDSELIPFWLNQGLKSKVDSCLLRYTIPLYELLYYEKKDKRIILDSLILQLLSGLSWRTFDNYNDRHELSPTTHLTSLLTCIQLQNFAYSRINGNIPSLLEHHYSLMTEQAILEKSKPIQLIDIWKRCSIFLFPAETIGGLSKENINILKSYINYTGLAHDLQDLYSDISNNVISLPIYWMREISGNEVFSLETVKSIYEKAQAEVKFIEDDFEEKKIAVRFPLINHLWAQSWRIFHGHQINV